MHPPIPKYDFPQQWAQQNGFRLFELKANRDKQARLPQFPMQTNIPHRHDFFEVFIFLQGKGTHEIDFQTFPFDSPSMHFIAPGKVHVIAPQEAGQAYILAFTDEFFELHAPGQFTLSELPFFKPQTEQPILSLDAEAAQYIQRLLDNLIQDVAQHPAKAKQVFSAYLQIILFKAQQLFQPSEKDATQGKAAHLVSEFQELIEAHFREKHQVQDYADLLAVTPSHLNRSTKLLTNQTASDHILNRIVLEAKRLLLFSELTNKEIAFQLHFSDPSYFSRIFRKKTGMVPSAFRQKMYKKYQH